MTVTASPSGLCDTSSAGNANDLPTAGTRTTNLPKRSEAVPGDAVAWAARVATETIDWYRCLPFVVMHAACLLVLWVGVSSVAVGVAVALFVVRMFFVTAFYHRYFSHRTYKTSRWFQFVMACLACTSGQRGPLWWAGHHRHHHIHSDSPPDPHSPRLVGFCRSHMGWFMTRSGFMTQREYVRDWERFPELRWLNKFDWLPLALLGVGTFALGALLQSVVPSLGTTGWQMLVWGFFVSTIVLYHSTYTINSFAHRIGRQRFRTGDDSRNNFLLALLTLGEGWHNNHHHYPSSARQGFYWWEVDATYYGLRVLAWLGLVWNLTPVPPAVLRRNRIDSTADASPAGGRG